MTNGFYLRIQVDGNFRLGKEILHTPYRLPSTLHEAPSAITHASNFECCCFLPGSAFFLECRSLMVQREKKDFESLILFTIDRCCSDFRRDALSIVPVHSFSDSQLVLYRNRDTVVAVLLSLPVGTVTVLVCLHLRKLTFTGTVWIRSNSTITSFLYHLGLNQLCGVRGEACWIVHNGEPVLLDQLFLGQGDVVIVWQKYDHEMADRQFHLKLREQSVDVDLEAISPTNLIRNFGFLPLLHWCCGEYCLFSSVSGAVFPECKVVICVLFLWFLSC